MVNSLGLIEEGINNLESRIGEIEKELENCKSRINTREQTIESNQQKIISYWETIYSWSHDLECKKEDLSEILDCYARYIVTDLDFDQDNSDWDFYEVRKTKRDVVIFPADLNVSNAARLNYHKFKKMFPDLADKLEESGRLTILGEFWIGDEEYPLSRNRTIFFDGERPDVRIITKEEIEEMRTLPQRETNYHQNQINNLESEIEKCKKELEEERRNEPEISEPLSLLQRERGYLNLVSSTAQREVKIKKSVMSSLEGSRPFYSLWADDSLVLLYFEGNFFYTSTTRKDDPLEINLVTKGMQELLLKAVNKAENELSFKEGDLITYSGIPIVGNNEIYASEIFQKVFTGIKILPKPEEPQGYQEQLKSGKTEQEIVYRHWGQIYLSSLNPENVNQGEILGSGGSYKSFQFGDRLVVEFDQEDRATYLFDPESFDELRMRNRSEIISENPKGFYGRVIHHENQKLWKKQISNFINE